MNLFNAAAEGDVIAIHEELTKDPDAINKRDRLGDSALHWAARNGHIESIRILLQFKANIDASGQGDLTPLCVAVGWGHTEVVRMLLHDKASVGPCGKFRLTPLHWAAEKGQLECAEMLLREGADPRAVNAHNASPLSLVTTVAMKELLLSFSAELTAQLIDKRKSGVLSPTKKKMEETNNTSIDNDNSNNNNEDGDEKNKDDNDEEEEEEDVPSTPTWVKMEKIGDNIVKVMWGPSEQGLVNGYDVTVRVGDDHIKKQSPPTDTSLILSDLPFYSCVDDVHVRAWNCSGSSNPRSDPTIFIRLVGPIPSAPVNFRGEVVDCDICLYWEPATNAPQAYQLQYRLDKKLIVVPLLGDAISFKIADQEPGTRMSDTCLRAQNDSGWGPFAYIKETIAVIERPLNLTLADITEGLTQLTPRLRGGLLNIPNTTTILHQRLISEFDSQSVVVKIPTSVEIVHGNGAVTARARLMTTPRRPMRPMASKEDNNNNNNNNHNNNNNNYEVHTPRTARSHRPQSQQQQQQPKPSSSSSSNGLTATKSFSLPKLPTDKLPPSTPAVSSAHRRPMKYPNVQK